MSVEFKPGDRVRILADKNTIPVGAERVVLEPYLCDDGEILVAAQDPPVGPWSGYYFFANEIEHAAHDGETLVVNEHTGGAKGAKLAQFSLLPWDILSDLAEHYAKGARKYSAHNWRKGYDWSLSIDALGRHLAAFIEGETYDPETGSHHMLAVMFHAAALVYFTKAFPELDDRRNTVKGTDVAH